MIRLLFALLFASLALPAWDAARAEPGTAAEQIARAEALDPGHGAVLISIRSEIYLEEPLRVYFVRAGGSIANAADVVWFERRQGFWALGNDTVEYQLRAYQLSAGSYRLVAHGIDCPKVPAETERCLIDRPGLLGTAEVSRPSRGYPAIAPSFEVRSGAITIAGDFALTSRNAIEWSEIPVAELQRVRARFARMPDAPAPLIPGEYRLRYGLSPRSYQDDRGRRY